MDYRAIACKLFVTHTKYQQQHIVKIIPIHNGYTNISFKVITNDRCAYQVRIANDQHLVDRKNEKAILNLVKNPYYLYFDVHTGNTIKQWIKAIKLNKRIINSQEFLQKLVSEINWLHQTKFTSKILKHNYFDAIKYAKLSTKHHQKYYVLLNKYHNLPLCLSHNDLSADNLLLTVKKQIIFIDYEWSRLNNEYWDLANFIRETKLSNRNITFLATKSNLSLTILQDFIYICTNYAYQWTYMMPQTTKILQYRKQLNKQLNLYYNKFF